jgi:thiol:disulfide interchange protein DsbD
MEEPGAFSKASPSTSIGESGGEIFGLLKSNNYFWIILSFFGFGLLLSFTPCVLPMIPIISGIIIAQGKDLIKKRAFLLSMTYVLGMALTYTAAGVAAGYSGRLISHALQNIWVLIAFALIFVALALSIFGLYELQLPVFIQNKLTAAGNRFKAGTFVGVFFIGLLSAIIISPCVTAPLAGALLYISRTNDVWLGGSALFALSLGMGVPLLIIGTSAGALLPRAGAWMKWVKVFFGILLLAVAFWIIYPVISPPLTSSLSFQRLTSLNQLEAQIKETQERAVMLYVSADWCVSCKEMEVLTFRDSRVKEKLKGVKLLKADVTSTNEETDAFLKRFGLFGPPAILFFDQKGQEIPGTRVIGVKKAEPFLIIINKAVPD